MTGNFDHYPPPNQRIFAYTGIPNLKLKPLRLLKAKFNHQKEYAVSKPEQCYKSTACRKTKSRIERQVIAGVSTTITTIIAIIRPVKDKTCAVKTSPEE